MRTVTDMYRPKEKLRDVAGYGGKYRVSSGGRVFSMKSGRLTEMAVINGRYVNFSKDGQVQKLSVAYLVARAFVPNLYGRLWVRHIDGDVENNSASNLEWCETKDAKPALRRSGGAQPASRKVMCYNSDGDCMTFPSICEAARVTGAAPESISRCLHGRQHTAAGYIWRAL